MRKALAVARWEYLEKVKSKAFLISLVLTPAIMIGMSVLPTFFVRQEEETAKVIGLLDRSGSLGPLLAERLEERYRLPDGQPRYIVAILASGLSAGEADARDLADERVQRGDIEGYLVLSGGGAGDSLVEWRATNPGDFRLVARVEETLRRILAEQRLRERGLEPALLDDLQPEVSVRSVKLTARGEEETGFEKMFFSAYIFLMMLFFLIFTSGQLLVRSVIEEKSNRIVEVLVSSCSPTDLMAGKVLGLSGLGFTQIAFWALIALGLSLQFGVVLVDPGHGLLLVLYFILGYLFYAAVFIALGSPLTTEQEAQQVSSYLVMLLILPVVLALPAIQNPDALWLRILTFIPFLTPTMMALRIPVQTPPAWEIAVTTAVMIVSIYGAMWVAGRIFRVALLATGKRPSLRDILRWVRTG
jgi:ABC-2 type transport system permease protein